MSGLAGIVIEALVSSLWVGAGLSLLCGLALTVLPRRNAIPRAAFCCAAVYALPILTVLITLMAPTAKAPDAVFIYTSTAQPVLPLEQVIFLGWLAGMLLMAARYAHEGRQAYLLVEQSQALSDAALADRLRHLAKRAGLQGRVRFVQCDAVHAPSVVGVVKATILIPSAAIIGLSDKELEAIIAHELAHVLRWDLVHTVMELAVKTVLFFNPFAFWLVRLSQVEREAACDAVAVKLNGESRPLATGLLKLSLHVQSNPLVLSSLGSRAADHLKDRVGRLMDDGAMQTSRITRRNPVAHLLSALMAFLALSVFGLSQHESATSGFDRPRLLALKSEVCDVLKRDDIYWNPTYDPGGEAVISMAEGQVFMHGARLPNPTETAIASVFARYDLANTMSTDIRYFGDDVVLTVIHPDSQGGTQKRPI